MTKAQAWRVDLYKIYKVVGLVGERAYHVMYHEAHSDHHSGHGQGFEHSLHMCVFNPCGR